MISKLDTNTFQKINLIKSREEILEELKVYRLILNQPIYDYLSETIALDISILKDYISSETRLVLSELKIYNEIVKYNIYNRTINLFKEEKENVGKIKIENHNGYLTIYSDQFNIKLFEFYYSNNMNNDIGHINICKTLEKRNVLDEDIEVLKDKIKRVTNKANPYDSYIQHSSTRSLAYNWELNRRETLEEYKKLLKNIRIENEVPEMVKKEIDLTNYTNIMLSNEYGLKENDFVKSDIEIEDLTYGLKQKNKLTLKKTLTKKTSNLTINIEEKYI